MISVQRMARRSCAESFRVMSARYQQHAGGESEQKRYKV